MTEGCLLMPPGLAAPRGAAPGGLDQRIDLLRRQVVVVPVLVAHHRRELAGAQALHLLDAEEAVGADLVEVIDPDPALDVLADVVAAAESTGEVGADVEVVLADRLQVEKGVEEVVQAG